MKIRATILFISSLMIISCTERNSKQVENNAVQDQTPEVLQDKGGRGISSISKRYQSDIIDDLYQEAMEKDDNLKSLNNKIVDMERNKNIDLKDYYEYIQNNKNYWLAVNSYYISQITDKELKKSTEKLFKELEDKYKKSIAKHQAVKSDIDLKTKQLNDHLVILKLMSTLEMMKNYQKNKLPKIETLKEVNNKYNQIIKETKDFIKK